MLLPLLLHLFAPRCPTSLNSLDLAGVRLLSPRDSQILPKTVAGADDASADDETELKWSSTRNVVVTMCLFLMISSGAQLGRSGI